jgi:hypothetical protein
MRHFTVTGFRRFAWVSLVVVAVLLTWAPAADASVKKIVIEKKVSPAFDGASFGAAGPYETIEGKIYGELDPRDPHNSIITDIDKAPRNANGKVEYVATFYIVKPIDMSKSSRLLWQDVPNRGGRVTIGLAERNFGDIGLSSGWQGDSSGRTVPGPGNDYAIVPIAKNSDGSPITGPVMARIFNVSGVESQPLIVHSNPVPYKPASLDTKLATLTTHAAETIDGVVSGERTVASSDWAWAKCTASNPFPGTPDPTQICLRNGFDPKLLYQVVFTAKDPPVLGIGLAAFRDAASFFKNAAKDDEGTPNPLAGQVSWVVNRGSSQSGTFLRALTHLGFTQDEANRKVYDGSWPIVAARRMSLNSRFAMPDGTLTLYSPGVEGPLWWSPWPDPVRELPTRGILDRCLATKSCPKIFEHFGAAEVWGQKLTAEWVGTSADKDIPLPANVRRYYIPSTPHGGGDGGFSVTPAAGPVCPTVNYGVGTFAENPVPATQTVNALKVHFRNWVMHDTPPPPSRWPTIADKTLVDATKDAMGFPSIPGLPATAPTGLINPFLDYDWGPNFNYSDATGVRSVMPPQIKQVIKLKVPKVDADGNELGGVPVVLREAPLGTYLGWNITSAGFFKGLVCNYAGGMIPFANTKAERLASGDPRLSLEERYRDHAGYVAAVKDAAAKAIASGFLLQADADALIKQAEAGNVLTSGGERSASIGGAASSR